MSKKQNLVLLSVVVSVSAWYFQRSPEPKPQEVASAEAEVVTAETGREPAAASPAQSAPQALANDIVLTETEKQSVDRMTETLSLSMASDRTLADLVSDLKTSGQEPLVTHDQNEYTGEMAIVRTESPLSGTRYFHAQYFKEESGKGYLQHASFEIKPVANAMDVAADSVRHAFKDLTRPHQQTADFIEWELDDHHVLWIKKMAAEDLKDNPFNAYSASDVGTVRVAIESRIHDDDEQ